MAPKTANKTTKKSEKDAILPTDDRFLLPLTGKETDQDLIDRFNELYRRQKKDERATDSLSSTGITKSQLLRSRECRMVMMRRFLVLSSLLLWIMAMGYTCIWVMTFYIWPLHFSESQLLRMQEQKDPNTDLVWDLLLFFAFLHPYVAGTWGLLSAFCCQERLLKQFILIVPWILLISITYSTLAIYFVSGISQEKIGKSMIRHMGTYYLEVPAGEGPSFSQEGWDRTQTYLRCCGLNSPGDWLSANEKLPIKLPDSCCMNKLGRRERDPLRTQECITGKHLDMVFPRGCKEVTFAFYTNLGAGLTAMGFIVSLLIILSVAFGHKFYILKRKLAKGRFQYPMKDYFVDFFCLDKCVKRFYVKQEDSTTKRFVKASGKNTAGSKLKTNDEMTVLFNNSNTTNESTK